SYVKNISIILLLTLTVNFLYLGYTKKTNFLYNWRNYFISEQNKATFSSKENIIIIILDTYQSNLYNEIINEDPLIKDTFKNFTYYKNTIGGFRETYPSMPLILASKFYDNSIPLREWDHKVFLSQTSLPYLLKKNNYIVDLYPMVPSMIYLNPKLASNVSSNGKFENILRSKIINVALMRSSPYLLKPLFYRTFYDIYDDKKYINSLIKNAKIGYQMPAFKFYHLWGLHKPLYLDENMNKKKGVPYNDYWYKQQGKADLKLINLFLDKLKEMKLYDKSLIIIMGDHGSGNRFPIRSILNYESDALKIDTPDFIVSVGSPLFLMKEKGSKGNFKISDAPVSLMDIAKTVLTSAGIKNKCNGKNIIKLKMNEERKRYFYFHNYFKVNASVGNDEGYYSTFTEYEVNGNAWDSKSWKKTYRLYKKNKMAKIIPRNVNIGDTVSFQDDGEGSLYQKYGWSIPEKTGTWTVKDKAYLEIPIKKDINDFLLDFICSSALGNQKVLVKSDGNVLGYLNVSSEFGHSGILIPKKYINNNELKLDLLIEKYKKTNRLSNDNRELGIHIEQIRISKLPKTEFPYQIDFSSSSKLNFYGGHGWSIPEKKGTWTDGNSASLNIPINTPRTDLIFSLQIGAVFKPQHLVLNINKKYNNAILVTKPGTYSFIIEKNIISKSLLAIDLKIPDASDFNKKNNDKRKLGIYVEKMVIQEIPDYKYGEKIDFKFGGNSFKYKKQGWSFPERKGTWTDGKQANLKIPIEKHNNNLILEMKIGALFEPQHLKYIVNGKDIGDILISKPDIYSIVLDKELAGQDELNINLKFPNAGEFNKKNNDSRKLGIFIEELSIKQSSS
ncbi:MAG: sulfatase-like hydrolase/transferase, partial [Candidatus Thorarchaeota archaeon]